MIVLDIIGKKTKYMSSVVNDAAAKSAAATLHFLGSACRHLSFLNELRSIFKLNLYNFNTLSIRKLVVTIDSENQHDFGANNCLSKFLNFTWKDIFKQALIYTSRL